MPDQAALWVTGDLWLDEVAQQATTKGREVPLSPLSFKVLLAVAKAHPQAVDHQTLIDQVWGDVAVSPETVTQRMALIRKAMSTAGLDPAQYIQAARHQGYRWRQPLLLRHPHNKPWRLLGWSLAAALLLGLLLVGWFNRPPVPDPVPPLAVTQVSAKVSAQELTDQAWDYLDQHTHQSSQLAAGLFRQALELDASEVNALTGLSIALSHQVTKFNQPDRLLQEAKQLAQRATELNPSHAQAWAALAFTDDAYGHIDQAIVGYEKAIELAPTNSSTISSVAYLYGKKGRLADALKRCVSVLHTDQLYLHLQVAQIMELLGFAVLAEQWYHKADVLSPDNVFATHQRARFYLAQNQPDQAIAVIDQAMQRGVKRPELPVLLGLVAWQAGDLSQAAEHFQAALAMDPEHSQAQWLVWALQAPAQQDEAAIAAALAEPQQWPDQWVYQAQFLAQQGELEAAMARLQLAHDAGYRHVAWLHWLPPLESLRDKPAWVDLLQVMQQDVGQQRAAVMGAAWLPPGFLDPQS
ncbi:winged helix-turn-helix transcriptional regulator [Marinicella meishanensis]|uniref:winged helix-turn-helix transcriptional regulator n=1 Tax=Marinicella meishanensis TaxID=2873263 RepID=UPI001CBFABBB|nr:winged helix-turn-helix transcriptional regulator [Marinicella sp. NBU2979]